MPSNTKREALLRYAAISAQIELLKLQLAREERIILSGHDKSAPRNADLTPNGHHRWGKLTKDVREALRQGPMTAMELNRKLDIPRGRTAVYGVLSTLIRDGAVERLEEEGPKQFRLVGK